MASLIVGLAFVVEARTLYPLAKALLVVQLIVAFPGVVSVKPLMDIFPKVKSTTPELTEVQPLPEYLHTRM